MTDASEVRDLYESAPCGFHSLDADGVFVFVNETELKWLGYARDELVGKLRFVDLLTEAGRRTFAENFPRFKTQGHIEDLEFEVRRKDGTTFPVLLNATAVVDRQGRFLHSRSVMFDITARKLTETALAAKEGEVRARQRELDGFFALSVDLLCIARFDGYFQRLNHAWERVLGFTEDELRAAPFMTFVHPDDQAPTATAFSHVLSGGRVDGFENRYRCKDGSYRWLSWSSIGLPELRVVYAAARDVTERRRTEALIRTQAEELRAQTEELKAQGDELRAQQRMLEERNVEVERASRLKSEFLANMSHELRTPLNAVIGFSELLLDEGRATFSPTHVKHLETVYASGRHLLELINDILDLVKIEAGRVSLSLELLEPVGIIAEATSLMEAAARKKDIRLTTTVRTSHAVIGDRSRVRQVLLNLLSNAIKFTPPGGSVEVGADDADAFVRFWVRDTGPGIPDALRPHLFQPFVQGESPLVKRHEGTGLGLAISRNLVEQHGGTIAVDGAAGQGATFSFTIPVARPTARVARDGKQAPEPRTAVASDDPRPSGRPVVVVVDDDAHTRNLMRAWLVEAGCDVLEVTTGPDAMSLIERARPQLVILDLVLPGADGLRVLETLRATPSTRDVPVVIASAFDDGVRALALGAVEFFQKPVQRSGFIARVLELVAAEPRDGAPAVLLIDDDPSVAAVLRPALAEAGYDVITATSGQEGLDRARRDLPRVVIVDLMLPDLSGFEVVEALARDQATRGLPVLVLTAADLSDAERVRLRQHARSLAEKGEFTADALLAAVRSAARGPVRATNPTGPSILVVDDHDLNRELAVALLERRGYAVLVASDGEDAVAVARRERPGLILMDLAMPKKDGYEAARELRADPATAGIPLVAFTALAMKSDEERVRQAGFDGYLAKPIERDALLRAVASFVPEPTR